MLRKIMRYRDLDVDSLFKVYEYSFVDVTWQIVNNFSEDLRLFFACQNTYIGQWMVGGAPVAAVRVEPYLDGYLISCLETSPQHRRMGYATALLCAVMEDAPGVYYAHVDRNNKVSMKLHMNLGFSVILDHAVHVDGSVFANSFTLKRSKPVL